MMNTTKNILIIVIVASFVVLSGCATNRSRSRRNISSSVNNVQEVEVSMGTWDRIALDQEIARERSERRHNDSMEYWGGLGGRVRKRSSSFGRSLVGTEKLRQKNKDSIGSWDFTGKKKKKKGGGFSFGFD